MDDGFKIIVIGELCEGAIVFGGFLACRKDDMLSKYILTLLEWML